MRFCRAMIFAAQDRRADAMAIVRGLEEASATNMSVANLVGRVYLALGDHDRALEWMTRAFDAGGIFIFWKDAPLFDPIRKDRRFVELLGRMGLPSSP